MTDQFPMKQVVNEDGQLTDSRYQGEITADLAKQFYKKLLIARRIDQKCFNLQRQGRIGTYVQYEGQEAAQVGSALAIDEGDWMFPTYRDHAATLTFGHSLRNLLLYWKGRIEGGISPEGKNIFPAAVPIASQLLHATGAAWAEKKKGTDRVSLVYFGDGATSEGDFHEGMNFASVFETPTIFFNQNNGYAISVPMEKQMKARTVVQKALGYDIEGVRIDGNDIFAVYFETRKAVERARQNGGPTLIEAITWRYNGHTTADNASKYRDQQENEIRRQTTDPLLRVKRYMEQENLWDNHWVEAIEEEIKVEIETAIKEMEAYPKPDISDLFHVFESPTWTIEEQKQTHLAFKREEA